MKKLLILLLLPFLTYAQSSPCDADVCVVQFNAGWNSSNDVEWVGNLKDCEVQYIDIAANADAQNKYEIVVVPTIIVFNGKEVKRFQADISFAMKATKKEVQAVVDEILMDQF
jgi:hypothetical protein|tara:strand:+ start:142 stop:480 length:339 start_codon:yes stop_codon:yes gene_type:complete